jgi:hypothetical protein
MEELIKQAFLHVEVIGPHVADGHYDLIGPNGEIILPQVWETMIEPDWSITMHMWPMPEPKPEPAPQPGHHHPFHPPERPSRHERAGGERPPMDPRSRAHMERATLEARARARAAAGGGGGGGGSHGPPPPPPAAGWPPPPPGVRGGPGLGLGPGGAPVVVMHSGREERNGGKKSSSKPAKGMLSFLSGGSAPKKSSSSGKGKYVLLVPQIEMYKTDYLQGQKRLNTNISTHVVLCS